MLYSRSLETCLSCITEILYPLNDNSPFSPHPNLWRTWLHFLLLWAWQCSIPQISGIMYYLFSHEWQTSPIMSSLFIHVVINGKIVSFWNLFKGLKNIPLYVQFLCPFICWRTLRLFPCLDCCEQRCNAHGGADISSRPEFQFFWTYTQKCDHMVVQFLIFWWHSILFSVVAAPFYIPTNSV